MTNAQFATRLEAVKTRFVSVLDQRLDIMEFHSSAITSATEGRNALTAIQAQAHKIAGTAATFGFTQLGEAAQHADQAIAAFLAGRSDANSLEGLSDLIEHLMDETYAIVGHRQDSSDQAAQ